MKSFAANDLDTGFKDHRLVYLHQLFTGESQKTYATVFSMSPHILLQIKPRCEAETSPVISQDTWTEVCTDTDLVTNLNTKSIENNHSILRTPEIIWVQHIPAHAGGVVAQRTLSINTFIF